ncbi:MAG: hypothetical protein GXP14_13865 [Gammaproteobacteria bacterium]|nr:hypothetical protein [Gammaproteobacteria bacterium]
MENGLMESIQVLLIVFSFILFFILAIKNTDLRLRLLCLTLTLLCFSFFLREVDIEDFNLPGIIILLGSGPGYRILLAILWLAIILYSIKKLKEIKPFYLNYLQSRAGYALFLSAGLLISGSFFDKELINILRYEFYEELLEMNGYFALVLSTFLTYKFSINIEKNKALS